MATPTADSYAGASGQLVSTGRYASRLTGGITLADAVASGALGSNAAALSGGIGLDDLAASGSFTGLVMPSWLSGKSVAEWFAISGTAVVGSAVDSGGTAKTVDSYNGLALKDDTAELFSLASGGHADTTENQVYSIDLLQNSPAWVQRNAATAGGSRRNTQVNGDPDSYAYNLDGKPCSRHTYWSSQWIAARNRLMNFQARFVGNNAVSFAVTDGFNPSNNTWDAAATWPNAAVSAQTKNPANGDVYGASGFFYLWRWNQSANTWAQSAGGTQIYGPLAFDTLRSTVFGLSVGDGIAGSDTTPHIVACRVNADLSGKTAISFNASAAYTEFQALNYTQGGYAAMTYDSVNDKFYWYCGRSGDTQKIYVITPNNTTTWDMSIMSVTGVTPAAAWDAFSPFNGPAAGCMNKFTYVPRLNGCVLVPRASSNVHFIRTS